MNILSRIGSWFSASDASPITTLQTRDTVAASYPTFQLGKAVWPERDPFTYQQEALRKIALIFRCVGVTANAVAAAPIRVYAENEDGETTTLPRHPMRQLMQRPNPRMRETRFVAFVAMTMAVSGFCVVEKVRSASGRVVELYPLRSDWVRPVPRSASRVDWEYRIPGYATPWLLDNDDVIVFPYSDRPDGSPTGIGPLEAALREFGLLNVMTDFLKAFFDGGAMPVYALVPRGADNGLGGRKAMTQAEADYVKAKWVSKYGGLHRAIEPAILDGIEDVKQLSFDFNQLAYTDLRDLADAAICQAFGVSPMLVDAMVGMKHSTYSNKQEARQGFYEDTITPLWARLDDILTLGLLPEFETRPGISMEFDTSRIPALQEDRNAKATWLVQGTLGGAISVHTLHRELNLPPPDGADYFLTTPDPVAALRSLPTSSETRMARLVPETRERIVTRNRDDIERLGNRGESALREFFREQAERILPFILDGGVDAVDWDREADLLRRVLATIHQEAGAEAFKAASNDLLVIIDWNLANPRVSAVLNDLAGRIVDISDTTRDDVRRIVGQALDEGVTLDELASRLRGQFVETYRGRSMAIARTESMVAYGKASRLAYEESGVVAAVELADNPRHTEGYGASDGLTCAQRDGLIVPLDKADRHIEAEHPNGSLALIPVLRDALGG
jgi:HK97 family phage portal protein